MGGIITEPMFLELFPGMNADNKSGAIQALVVAIYEVGCLFGACFIIAFGDRLGRRRSVLLGASIMLIGAAIQTASFSLAQLIVGRIVTGVGNGMNTSTIPVWQSEMAPPKIRGFLVLFEGALITGGIMLSYWLNYGFWFVTDYGSFQWRFPIAFQAVFGVILIIGVLLYPESPRWLLKHGKQEAAASIMADLHDATVDDASVQEDIDEILELNAATDEKKLTWKEMFTNGKDMNLWRFCAACGCQAMQQISGINLVTYYSTVVFEDNLDFSPSLARFLTGWLGTEYFIAATLALFVVDRFGRRNLMMFGAAGMALCLAVIGGCLAYSTPGGSRGPALAATVFIFIYDTFFAIGWLGIGWLYPAEVTTIRTRAETAGFSTVTNWLMNYAVVQLAPIMINTIAWKTYFVFFCFNIAFVPLVYFFLPETNGWKLETLDAIFNEAHKNEQNPVFTEKAWRRKGWTSRRDSAMVDSTGEKDESTDGERHVEEVQRR